MIFAAEMRLSMKRLLFTASSSSSCIGVVKTVMKASGAHLKVDDVIVEFE